MFVRFSQHKPTVIACSLVESRRRNGAPRQSTVAYLGAISTRHAQSRKREGIDYRRRFWRRATAALDELAAAGTITAADRDAYLARIAQRVYRVGS